MNRRRFFRNTLPAAVTMPAFINGFSFTAFAGTEDNPLATLLGTATDTDHVLVLVQLNGGNDGINMVIPLDVYGNYYNARTNVAIPQSKALRLNKNETTGLHPAMTGLQNLYNDGKSAIVQAVGYDKQSFSHFRSNDMWMSGDDTRLGRTTRNNTRTGWLGRYLESEYPGYPDAYPNASMPDPLAIQINAVPTLDVQGPILSMGLAITNPENFYDFQNPFKDYPLDSPYANKELRYIRVISEKTRIYSEVIKNAYNKSKTLATYPTTNYLGEQLKIVARLIKGGLKTRVYTVSIGGFDTHKKQVNASDTTTGNHANLMRTLSEGVTAFQKDLELMELDKRVIGMTFSEFGRRIKSNASLGTDHGAAAPLILFGKNINAGILGKSPEIPADIRAVDNLPYQYDFRSIYASVLERWFCVKQPVLTDILFKNYQSLPIIKGAACGLPDNIDEVNNQSDKLVLTLWPNPYVKSGLIRFSTFGGFTSLKQFDSLGRLMKIYFEKDFDKGLHTIDLYDEQWPAGVYYLRLQNGSLQKVISVLKMME